MLVFIALFFITLDNGATYQVAPPQPRFDSKEACDQWVEEQLKSINIEKSFVDKVAGVCHHSTTEIAS